MSLVKEKARPDGSPLPVLIRIRHKYIQYTRQMHISPKLSGVKRKGFPPVTNSGEGAATGNWF
jgi:hypothetical protein